MRWFRQSVPEGPDRAWPSTVIRAEPATVREFRERLADTVSWCAARADASRPRDCLRDPYLRPRSLERDYFSAVQTVLSSRMLQAGSPLPRRLPAGGRLMVYFPEQDLSDGAAELESGGFFDVFNAPPWDTWVGFFQEAGARNVSEALYLLAWVPPALVEIADSGIEANPEQCIRWLDETDCAIREVLAG